MLYFFFFFTPPCCFSAFRAHSGWIMYSQSGSLQAKARHPVSPLPHSRYWQRTPTRSASRSLIKVRL
ncbi:hypothetical protein NMG60_11001825 [Bertholletia excelsa]